MLSLVLLITLFLSLTSLSNEIENGGFEELNGSFQPVHWSKSGRPFVNIDSTDAHSGSNAAKVSANNFYYQNISASGNLAYTLGTYTKGDTSDETALFTAYWYINSELSYSSNSWRSLTSDVYNLSLFNFLSPPDAYSVRIMNRTRYRCEWMFEDDVFFIDEILDNGGFETVSSENPSYPEDWQPVGSPFYDTSGSYSHTGSSAIAVNANDIFYQDISIATPNKTYVISFWAKAQSTITNGIVSVDAIDYSADIVFSDTFSFEASTEYQLFNFNITPPENVALLRISLGSQNFTRSVLYDDIHFLFYSFYPDKFSPNNDDFRDTTDIYFLLDSDAAITMDILDDEDNFVERLIDNENYSVGVHKIVWDGIDKNTLLPLSDGTYKCVFDVSTPDTDNIPFSGNIIIDSTNSYNQSSTTPPDFFPVGIWFHDGLGMFYYPGYYDITFDDIAQHNFNTIIANQFSNDNAIEMLAAAEINNLKILYNDYNLQLEVYDAVYFEPLDEDLIKSRVEDLVSLIGSSEALLGYYLFDEPQFLEAQDLKELNRLSEHYDPEHLSYCCFHFNPQTSYTFDEIGLKLLLIDYYVIGNTNQSVGDFGSFISKLEEVESFALQKNVPSWIILQCVSAPYLYRMPTPEEIRCQVYLSIAHNFKGIFYFLYQSLDTFYLTGLVDNHLNPSELYESLSELNSEMIVLSPTLLDLSPYDFSASISGDAIVKTFQDSISARYLIVVNTNCVENNNVTVQTEDIGIVTVLDVLNSTEIPFTTDGSQISINLNLPPGDGRVLKLSTESLDASPIDLASQSSHSSKELTDYFSYTTTNPANNITFYNDYGFIGEDSYTIEIVDISNPEDIQHISTIEGISPTNLFVDNDRLFVSDCYYGLLVYDISDINSPELIGEDFGHTGNASDAIIISNTAYVASGSKGLKVLDITDIENIGELGSSGGAFDATAIDMKDNFAFITDLVYGLLVCDFSDVYNPTVVYTADSFAHSWDIKIDSNYAFIAANEYGLEIIDISNPLAPFMKGNFRTRSAYNLDKYGQFVFIADGTGGLKIIDCGNLLFPKIWAEYKIFPAEIVRDIKIHNGYAFIAYGNGGIVSIPLRDLIPTLVPEKLWELY